MEGQLPLATWVVLLIPMPLVLILTVVSYVAGKGTRRP